MMPRRLLALLAVPALAAGLAACGPDDQDSPATPTAQEETTPAEPTEEGTTEEEAASDEPTEESSTAEEPTEEESGPEVSPTSFETMWIDDSWSVEAVEEDLCEMGGGYASPYSEQEDLFVCGPTAAGAQACALAEGTVQCIVDPVGRTAIEFDSPTAPQQVDSREGDPMPLLVNLPDDVTCTTISHDHDQHWDGMFSWYRCDDGSELLTSEDIADTFERGKTWTVQRSMDKGEPESTAVISAVYAGR
ncbi:hypothetical protein GCM10023160_27090 [Brachybacterium paraconglomeratum]|uniref:hypothetical protein n=1 Tax=Brachybacterium paraconglomeratum TaxID=173362 RepID=UPI0031E57EE2